MKGFWAIPVLVRAALASKHAFSVNEDILAFPQYQLTYADAHISRDQGLLLLKRQAGVNDPVLESNALQKQDPATTWPFPEDPSARDQVTYEMVRKHDRKYLCSIPLVIDDGGDGINATESKEQERAALEQARSHGWELLAGMKGRCIYFRDGWWTYKYCHGQGVKQFHALPPQPGFAPIPPMEDSNAQKFTLGEVSEQGTLAESDSQAIELQNPETASQDPAYGALETRGGVNYLVQKLDGGSLCDLTGKPRKIEVQFHCSQTHEDRIEMIKETATCAYLMVIKTPKLCDDVAFLPPQVNDPNYITCAPVLSPDEDPSSLPPASDKPPSIPNPFTSPPLPRVGTWEVGAHNFIPADKPITKGAILRGKKSAGAKKGAAGDGAILSSDGKVQDNDALRALGIKTRTDLEKFKRMMDSKAKGKPWTLEVEGDEVRGVIDHDAGRKKDAAAAAVADGGDHQPVESVEETFGSVEEYFSSEDEPHVVEGSSSEGDAAASPPEEQQDADPAAKEKEDQLVRDLSREIYDALQRRARQGQAQGEGDALVFWDELAGEMALDPAALEAALNAMPRAGHDEL